MRKYDDILWHILAIIGLNFVNIRLGPLSKFFRMLSIIGFTFSLLHIAIENLFFIEKRLYKEAIVRSLLYMYSGTIWCIAYFKRKAISFLVLEVYRKRNYYNTSKKT